MAQGDCAWLQPCGSLTNQLKECWKHWAKLKNLGSLSIADAWWCVRACALLCQLCRSCPRGWCETQQRKQNYARGCRPRLALFGPNRCHLPCWRSRLPRESVPELCQKGWQKLKGAIPMGKARRKKPNHLRVHWHRTPCAPPIVQGTVQRAKVCIKMPWHLASVRNHLCLCGRTMFAVPRSMCSSAPL